MATIQRVGLSCTGDPGLGGGPALVETHAVRDGKEHWWRQRDVWDCDAQAFQDLAEDLPWAKHMQCEVVRDTGGDQ